MTPASPRRSVLVTGGAGAIGSRLVRALSEDNHVVVLDDLSSGFAENLDGVAADLRRGSILDEEALHDVFVEPPRVVFHLAASFANQNSIDHPERDLLVNALGTLKLLKRSVGAGVTRFVFASSSSVYADAGVALSEGAERFAVSTPYALTKRLAEQYVTFYQRSSGLPTVSLRIFNSYGPGEHPGKYRNVIPNFVHWALNGQSLIITGTGRETRDFTYVDDVVRAFVLAASAPEAVGGTFNVGSGSEITINELAELIRSETGRDVPVEHRPRRDWDAISRRCADISRIQRALGYSPSVSLRDGLARTVQWFLENGIADYRPT